MLPLLFIVMVIFAIDPFKIFGFKNDYYTDTFVGVNRGMVTTKTYNHLRLKEKYDSFILGSSRSHAFHCTHWSKFLNNAKPFHFDANCENILGISQKLQYIDELDEPIRNALVVLDRGYLHSTELNSGHLFVTMPCVSKQPKWRFYKSYVSAALSFRFWVAYIDYTLFGTYRNYMNAYIDVSGDYGIFKTADLIYGQEELIKKDSISYYKDLTQKGVFYTRPISQPEAYHVTETQKRHLNTIKRIFDKHKTQYKIVISPLYNQVPLEKEQLELLQTVFGKTNVFDFSGKNEFTEPVGNYYESSHYKPLVANKIMTIIYKNQSY